MYSIFSRCQCEDRAQLPLLLWTWSVPVPKIKRNVRQMKRFYLRVFHKHITAFLRREKSPRVCWEVIRHNRASTALEPTGFYLVKTILGMCSDKNYTSPQDKHGVRRRCAHDSSSLLNQVWCSSAVYTCIQVVREKEWEKKSSVEEKEPWWQARKEAIKNNIIHEAAGGI